MTSALLIAIIGLASLIGGVLIGRYYVPDSRAIKRAARHGRAYARGLSALLARDVDRCIEELTGVVEENVTDVEPYFALGALFRNRGEHERAIRVHQAIAVRADATDAIKARAQYELGLDFRAAGFPRRAARALEDVIAENPKNDSAVRALAALYEETGQWERSHAAWRRLGKLTKAETGPREAHLLAEAARVALRAGDGDQARQLLRDAEKAGGREVPHVLAVRAEYARARGDLAAAAEAYTAALLAWPELASYWAGRLLEVCEAEPEKVGEALAEAREKHPDHMHVELAIARWETARDLDESERLLRKLLADSPALLPARAELARLVLARGDAKEIAAEYKAMVEATQAAERAAYRCSGCSYATVELFWRCPSCRRWDTAQVAWGRRAGEVTPEAASQAALAAGGSAFVFGRPRLWAAHERVAKELASGAPPAPAQAPDAGIYEGRGAIPVGATGSGSYPKLAPEKPSLWGRMKGWLTRKVPAEEKEDDAPRPREVTARRQESAPPRALAAPPAAPEVAAEPAPPAAPSAKSSAAAAAAATPATEAPAPPPAAEPTVIVAAEPPPASKEP
ncbi:MAG: hypothetical protein IT370_19255 [Deltaproteobacteria bacterium]|nr:hypothetical protein [Deltaproteobacteria bacterium]